MAIKKESTHQLIHRNLTLYQRERSAVWQCRYKVDNEWMRATTKETQFDLAVNKAKELLVEAEIRKRSGIPVVTKRFKDIAMLAIDRMERDLKGGLVLLSERMQHELAIYIAAHPPKDMNRPLFPTQRAYGFTPNTLTHVINGLYRQAGLNGATSHSGRRGFLTRLSEKGVSVRVMMQLAGHSQMSTTQRYIDTRPDILRNAVELI